MIQDGARQAEGHLKLHPCIRISEMEVLKYTYVNINYIQSSCVRILIICIENKSKDFKDIGRVIVVSTWKHMSYSRWVMTT